MSSASGRIRPDFSEGTSGVEGDHACGICEQLPVQFVPLLVIIRKRTTLEKLNTDPECILCIARASSLSTLINSFITLLLVRWSREMGLYITEEPFSQIAAGFIANKSLTLH